MKAIILAAGKGVRLQPLSENKPKCLFRIGNETAISRQLRLLSGLGIIDIIVVVGYEAEKVEKVVGKRAKFILNSKYEETSSTYSLWKAKKELNDDLLVLNSDIVYTEIFLRDLVRAAEEQLPVCLAVNTHRSYEEIDVGVKIVKNRVVTVNKNMSKRDCDGESLDGFFVAKEGCKRLGEAIEKLISRSCSKGGIYKLKNQLALEKPLDFKDVGNNCMEFDTGDEYKKVLELFC